LKYSQAKKAPVKRATETDQNGYTLEPEDEDNIVQIGEDTVNDTQGKGGSNQYDDYEFDSNNYDPKNKLNDLNENLYYTEDLDFDPNNQTNRESPD